MNVTVFGATGAIGAQVVDQLRANGHGVTAYVRNPGKVPATWGDDVTVVVGEITDAAAIDRAVAGADAVVSALGPAWTARPPGCRWSREPSTSSPPCSACSRCPMRHSTR